MDFKLYKLYVLLLSGIWKEDPIAEWVSVKDLLQNKDTRG